MHKQTIQQTTHLLHTDFMIETHKENNGLKPKTRLKLETSVFNPSSQTNSLLSELLINQNQPLKITKEPPQELKEKSLGKRKLDLKSALFSLEIVNNQNTGSSDSDQNIIKSSPLQEDESIQESTKIDSTKEQEDIQEMPPLPQIEPTEEKPVIKEVQIEVTIWMTRAQFAEAVRNLSKNLKDKQIEAIEEYKNREIITEMLPESEPRPNGYKKYYQNKKPRDDFKIEPPMEIKKEGMIQRIELTEEEKLWKEKLSNSAAKTWLTGKRTEVDPEEALKKDIKFNLNLLTKENFEKIKEVVLNIACQKVENCQKLAEILVENAWTQKKYMNTYAKLCAFLGKQESLEFNTGKNYLKIQILKHIQTVFEEEQEVDEKKRRFFGNISFIGELFLEKFLPVAVVYIITSSFLNKFVWQYHKKSEGEQLYEETLEGLVMFYDIIGKALEEKEASMKKNKNKKADNVVGSFKDTLLGKINSTEIVNDEEISTEKVFKILDVILQEITLTPRLDSLVKNLKYRRDNGWIVSLTTQQGPKTFKELHEEFEKEKIEEEKRGEEYRQELKSSYNHHSKTRKDQPVFQVINNSSTENQKNQKLNQQIKEEISVDIKPGMFGRPKRPNKNHQQQQQEQCKMSQEEIERDLKEIYNNKGVKELKALVKKAGNKEVLEAYLKTFFDGRLEIVKERYYIHHFLFENVTKEEFLKMFMERVNTLYEIACDFPGIEKHFAIVLLDYCQKTAESKEVIDGIAFDEEFYETEEAEFILEFYQEMLREIKKALNEDYKDLKEKIGTKKMKKLAKRVQIDDFENLE